ncbi:MAG: class I SAM-dependent methyltransferase [Bdellovibrionales bacterium]
MSTTKEQLDQIAKNYHLNEDQRDMFIEHAAQDFACSWISKNITKTDKVLELGYGDGIVTSKLKSFGDSYTVIEGSPNIAEQAKNEHPEIEVVCSLFEDFKSTLKYDKIIAGHVLEHVDNPIEILLKIKSWMHESSEIIVIVPNANSIHRQLAVLMGLQEKLDTLSKRDHLVGHQRVYTPESLEADIQASGLKTLERSGFFLKSLPNSMMLDYSEDLIKAMNSISEQMPFQILSNLAFRLGRSE